MTSFKTNFDLDDPLQEEAKAVTAKIARNKMKNALQKLRKAVDDVKVHREKTECDRDLVSDDMCLEDFIKWHDEMTGFQESTATAGRKRERLFLMKSWPLLAWSTSKTHDDDHAGEMRRLSRNDEERKRRRLESLKKLKEEKKKQEEKIEEEKKKLVKKQDNRDKIMEAYVENVKSGLAELQGAMKRHVDALFLERRVGQQEASKRLKELVEVGKSLVEEQKINNMLFEKLVDKL